VYGVRYNALLCITMHNSVAQMSRKDFISGKLDICTIFGTINKRVVIKWISHQKN
jgi:hypothetical protein